MQSVPRDGRAEEANMPPMYRVLVDDDLGYGKGAEEPARRRFGFGAGEVWPLVDGEIHW